MSDRGGGSGGGGGGSNATVAVPPRARSELGRKRMPNCVRALERDPKLREKEYMTMKRRWKPRPYWKG